MITHPQISINTLLEKKKKKYIYIYTSYSKLLKELKDGIGILVGQLVFKLWIKTYFDQTQERHGQAKF